MSEDGAARGVDAADTASEEGGGFTARERAAIHVAEKMAVDYHNIGDDDVAAMRRLFADAEFLELWRGSTSALAGCWRCCSWRWSVVRFHQGVQMPLSRWSGVARGVKNTISSERVSGRM